MGYNTSQFLSLIFHRNQRLATQADPLESSSNHIHNGRKTLRLSLLKSDSRPRRRGISGLAMSPVSALQNNPNIGRPPHWSTCISLLGLRMKEQTHPASNHSLISNNTKELADHFIFKAHYQTNIRTKNSVLISSLFQPVVSSHLVVF